MAVSVLRCEPYLADNSQCAEYRHPLPFTLWRVFVDDECIATEALPFSSDDSAIELRANKCFPFLGDGGHFVCVRQTNNQVLWFGFHEQFISIWEDNLPVNQIYRFNAQQYRVAIQQAQARDQALLPAAPRSLPVSHPSRGLRRLFPWLPLGKKPQAVLSNSGRKKSVPLLEQNELRTAMMQVFPQDLDFPLYRLPENPADPRGRLLFHQVWKMINTGPIQICDPPEKTVEIRIGLDKFDFIESLWYAGRMGDEVAIFFEAEPHFPLWVSGFASAFRQETFLDG